MACNECIYNTHTHSIPCLPSDIHTIFKPLGFANIAAAASDGRAPWLVRRTRVRPTLESSNRSCCHKMCCYNA
jgi:hypothetical protein